MLKLLHAGFRRYTHGIMFWIGIVASVAIGLYSGKLATRFNYFKEEFFVALLIVYAIVVSLIIGREFSDGIFRNKITAGHSKGKIFISEAILAIGAVMFMYLISSACYISFKLALANTISASLLFKLYLSLFVITLSTVCFFVLISCCISNKTVAVVVNILLVLVFMLIGDTLPGMLAQPKENKYYYGGGQPLDDEHSYMLKNPDYIDEPLRSVAKTAVIISPMSVLHETKAIIAKIYRFSKVEEYEFESYGHYTGKVYTPDEKRIDKINELLMWQCMVIAAALACGYLVFRKKDFK